MLRIREICFAILAMGVFTCGSFYGPFAYIAANIAAQSQTQLVPLVTDQTPLALPNVFGVPRQGALVNQSGDYAFSGNGSLAVFYRRAGTGAPVRVMQAGDEVPGFPGSSADVMQRINLNNSGLLAFHMDFFQSNGVGQGIIFTFNGTSLQRIVAGDDPAPGGGGASFGRTISLAGLNDSGDIAFFSSGTGQSTLYIVPAGGAPVRVAGVGDVAPGTAGGTFGSLTQISLIQSSFNNLGEELFRANITGGSGGHGLFVGNTSGVRKVVASGDLRPEGGTFPAPTTGFLNNTGQVAFQAGSLYINTPGTGTSLPVATGDAVPAPVGGTFGASGTSWLIRAFNDAGVMAFNAPVAGSAVSNSGIFRFLPGNPVDVVAYRNQAVAGTGGSSFNSWFAFSMNSTGVISFQGILDGGSVLNGIFQQTGSNPPVNVALDGQATALPGGGTYNLMTGVVSATQTLNNGSVYFNSDIQSSTAYYGEFLISGGVTTALMTTADTLPAGARVSFRTFRVSAAGDYVGFLTQHPGGPTSIAVHHIANHATSVLVSDGDMAPGTGGGRLRILSRDTVFVNSNGSAAFSAAIIGGSVPGTAAVFLASPGVGVTKVAVLGDVVSGGTLSGPQLNQVTPSPLNDAGQVALIAFVPGGFAVFVWSPGTGLAKIAAVGDITSSGGTITSLVGGSLGGNSLSINSVGQVAFMATTTGGLPGIYVGQAGGIPSKVVAAGDAGPSGSTFSGFAAPGFNDSGEVAFMATLTGGPGGGVFLGSTSGPPV